MKDTKFHSQFFNPRHAVAEKLTGKKLVSLTGYVPMEVQIQSMMAAGMRLQEARRGMYDSDYQEGVPDDKLESGNIDMRSSDLTDIMAANAAVNERLQRRMDTVKKIKEDERKRKEEGKKKVSDVKSAEAVEAGASPLG